MIKVYELFGEFCITLDDGIKLREMMLEAIEQSDKVLVSFENVSVFMSTFFNAAFGALLEQFSKQDIKNKIELEDMSEDGRFVLERVLESAEAYYKDQHTREIIDELIREKAED